MRSTTPLAAAFGAVALCLFSPPASAQTGQAKALARTDHAAHAYTPYEQLVLKNVSQFHKNFNARQWAANGALVADDFVASSNGAEVIGREAFVKRIARFAGPFPDVKIHDLDTVVDGNIAMIRFVITGTHKGDFKTRHGVIKASGRSISVDGFESFVFDKDGKLTRLVTVERMDQLLEQIGAK